MVSGEEEHGGDTPEPTETGEPGGEPGFLPRSMHWPLWAAAALLAVATVGGVTIIPRLLPG